MSNQPSTSEAYHQNLQTKSCSNPSAGESEQSDPSEGNESDNDEAVTQRRGLKRPQKDEVKSCAQLDARSKEDKIIKKPMVEPVSGLLCISSQGEESGSRNEEEDESTSQHRIRSKKGRFAKKPKTKEESTPQPRIRSKKGRFAKKPKTKPTNKLPDLPTQEEVRDSEEQKEEKEESTSQPRIRSKKGRFAKKPKTKPTNKPSDLPTQGESTTQHRIRSKKGRFAKEPKA